MNEDDVLKALQASVIAAVAGTTFPTLPIMFINVTFNKPDNGKWLELVHLPNNGTDQTWGDEKNYRGIFRFILHWPNDGSGTTVPMKIIDSMCAYYKKSNRIDGTLNLLNQARVTNVYNEDIGLSLVASLEYDSFSP